jgi:hypothetical protein
VKDTIYVIVNQRGFVKANKTPGFTLDQGERAFRVDIEVPNEAFQPPLLPKVTLTIPREALVTEIHADVDMGEGPTSGTPGVGGK